MGEVHGGEVYKQESKPDSVAERARLFEARQELFMIDDQLIQMEEHFKERKGALGSDTKGESAEDILELQQYIGALHQIITEIDGMSADMAAEAKHHKGVESLRRDD